MADGELPGACDWGSPMATYASIGDCGPKRQRLSVVGGTETPRRLSLGLDGEVEDLVGNRLRAMYDTVLREPIPDRLLDLARQLEHRIAARSMASRPLGNAASASEIDGNR